MKVSIITPIYNTPKVKLHRCLDSVKAQTFTDWECLLVDDGSKDDSFAICQQYAAEDARFKALHKENGGVSSARNYGLEHAEGEWIAFLDSDDAFAPDHLQKMLSAATDDVDIVMTGFEDVRKDGSWYHRYKAARYIGKDGVRRLFRDTDFLEHQIPWDRMYRNLNADHNLDRMHFDEHLSLSEDRLFAYNYLLHVKGVACIPDVTYIHDATDETSLTYRKHPSSVNAYKYATFKKVTDSLIKYYALQSDETKRLHDYLESCYAQLINAYRDEGKLFRYHLTRILHKLKLK